VLEPGRARKQIARCRRAEAKRALPEEPKELLEGFCAEPNQEEQIAVSSKGLMLAVRLADVEWLESADDCVELHVGKRMHRLRDTLAVVAAKLPPGRFVQISSSTLVNVDQIAGLQPMFFGEYEVLLRNGTRLALSRGCQENLRRIGH
jgi:two-component system, LytTR family, response regulator